MYVRWTMPHPIAGSPRSVGASDVSAHRIVSGLSAFIGHVDPSKHRILAAGNLNMIYGAYSPHPSVREDSNSIPALGSLSRDSCAVTVGP